MTNKTVDILLATYNGEKYLKEQIDSILNQTHTKWNLIIRDDGSTDNTLNIIEEYKSKYFEKIHIIKDEFKNVGVNKNFSLLMNHSKSDYIMFCDQDDFWLPQKIELTFELMIKEEKKENLPILIFSDLKVVDDKLNIKSNSFWKTMLINPKNVFNINNLVVRNPVTGCTIMMNIKLKNIIKNIPTEALVHDWWISLTACLFGKINYVEQPTILYRQHSNNVLGASKNKRIKSLLLSPYKIINQMKNKELLFQKQTKKILDTYRFEIKDDRITILETHSTLSNNNYFFRILKRFKYKLWADNWMHNILLFFY
jgi:glycosyltransferase involved in cell wall biosynthesis